MQNVWSGKQLRQIGSNRCITGVLKLLIGGVLIVVFIRQIQWNTFRETILSVNISYMLLGIALTFFNMFIAALRWDILIRALDARIPFLKIVKLLFIGSFFNTFLPGGFAGDIVRSLQSKGEGISIEDALSSVFTDRLLGLVGFVFLTMLGVLWQWDLVNTVERSGYIILICAILMVLVGVFYSRRVMMNFHFIISALGKWGQKIESLYRSLYQYRHKVGSVSIAFAITIINHLIMFASVYYLALSLKAHVSFVYFVVFLPIIGTLSMIPVTVGALGVREFGFVLFFPLVGMTKAQALGTSLFFFMTVALVALTGALFYLSETINTLVKSQTIGKDISH